MKRKMIFEYICNCLFYTLTFFLLLGAGIFLRPIAARADEPVVIVIDPGHGGENLGAEYEGYTEKNMTMITARAMKEELEKYDGVEVYLTRETDMDMSIKDRAVFASEKNADFLFCLHYNMSAEHTLFGAEVWVSAAGEYYARGYSYAQVQMKEFTDIGLYSRGIKTRLNNADDNYYGILRHCTEEGVPSVLIEHCHLDHDKDKRFYQQGDQMLEAFGRMDAEAAAKYFGLKSEALGIDYSDYPVPETDVPDDIVRPDKTEPEQCSIEVTSVDEKNGEVTVLMKAQDKDSYILYYNYSLDGGETYTLPEEWPRPEAWNRSSEEYCFTVTVPFDEQIFLKAGASNGFDVWAQSNMVTLDPIPDPARIEEELRLAKEKALKKTQPQYEEIGYELQTKSGEEQNGRDMILPVLIVVLAACMVVVSFLMAKMILKLLKGSKKR